MVLVVLSIFVLGIFENICGDDIKHVGPFLQKSEGLEHAELFKHVGDLSSCKQCGLIYQENSSDILNAGEVKPPFKYPWMAAIQIGRKKICAGALLSEQYILTAAHCLINNSTESEKMVFWRPENISIGFLTHTSFVIKSSEVKKIIPHSGFNVSDAYVKHDICLLEVKEKLSCSKFKNPVCLPPAKAVVPDGQLLEVSGWDIEQSEPADPVKPLKESEIKKVKFENCASLYPNLQTHYHCLVNSKKESACHFDAGSPMSFRRNGKHYVLGVASMLASDRCRNGDPFIFTPVPDHIAWIEEKTGLSAAKCEDFKEK